MTDQSPHLQLALQISEHFQRIPSVKAIALGGSQSEGAVDAHSDIDLYVYASEIIPLAARQNIANTLGTRKADLNLTFWDLGDEWFDLETGIEVDLIYWDPAWIEDQINRVLISHQASMGYTTCFWHTVLHSTILFDRTGWFANLQQKCQQPYPEPLKRAIIAKNHPVLRNVIPSYFTQTKKAVDRNDLISINHRLAALFASYFDVLFALNETPHPGEKKLLPYIREHCTLVPQNLEDRVREIFQTGATGDEKLLHHLEDLLDDLDETLRQKGFDPSETRE